MKWKVKFENLPDVFDPVKKQLTGTTIVNGIAIFDDGFAADGSQWGDDESNAILKQQLLWESQDPENNCYACEWAGL